MKFIVQRVRQSSVVVRGETIASIQKGLLVLVGIQRGDSFTELEWMSHKLVNLRIFEDDEAKMNRSVKDVKGELLIVPNFTLYADVSQGHRPGFNQAEAPGKARNLYNQLVSNLTELSLKVESGEFGADMDVELLNDGPVTIILEKEAGA